jgi:ASC-1-like (ASCH) protein
MYTRGSVLRFDRPLSIDREEEPERMGRYTSPINSTTSPQYSRPRAVATKPRDWQSQLLASVQSAIVNDSFWSAQLPRSPRLHLAILREPYLSLVLVGRKTIESRFVRTRRPPYRAASAGDALILKRSSGPVLGIALVEKASFHELAPSTLAKIKEEFSHALAVPNRFWKEKARARYATLLHPPIACAKTDRQPWVVLTARDDF